MIFDDISTFPFRLGSHWVPRTAESESVSESTALCRSPTHLEISCVPSSEECWKSNATCTIPQSSPLWLGFQPSDGWCQWHCYSNIIPERNLVPSIDLQNIDYWFCLGVSLGLCTLAVPSLTSWFTPRSNINRHHGSHRDPISIVATTGPL